MIHTYQWGSNADQHWCMCKCGAQLVAPEGHSYNQMNICSGCGTAKDNPSNDTVPTAPPQTEPPVTEPDASEPVASQPTVVVTEPSTPNVTEPSTPFGSEPVSSAPVAAEGHDENTEVPWLVIAIAAVVIVGSIVVIIIMNKKKDT